MTGAPGTVGTLLPTKLFIPLLEPDVLARERLLERLTAGRGAGLILVSAPAGAGKTTLIADWVRRCGVPTGWISLDPTDDEPRAFLRCIAEATDTLAAGAGERARMMLGATSPVEPLAIALALVADLAAAEADGVVVLDDYHVLSDSRIHEILAFMIERAPVGCTWVVITRSDPPLPLPRLRVRRRLREIREADLSFGPGEVAEFIRRFSGRELQQGSVDALAGRTEGWAAGLQLAGLALRQAADPDAFVAGFQGTHAFVADYLTDEVMAAMSDDDQRFVVRTSLLDRFCAALCDAALETTGSQERIEALFRSNMFLVPLDAERRWFRFHQLFADLLRRRSDRWDEAERDALLARASAWCEANAAVDDAFRYAMRSGDTSQAAELAARYGIQALAAGEAYTALRWTQRLPDEIVASSPDHCVLAAMANSLDESYDPVGRLAGLARELLSRGERPYPYVDDAPLHARWVDAAAWVIDGADPEPALAEFAAVWDEAPAESLPLLASVQLVTGNLLRLHGRYVEAMEANRRALEIGLRAESDLLRLAAVTGLAESQILHGELQHAIATASAELERPQVLHQVLGTQVANIAAILALALCETGEMDGVERALDRARTAIGFGNEPGDGWPPATRLGAVRHVPFHSSSPAVLYGLAAHVRLLLRRGQLDAARRCLEELERGGTHASGTTPRVLLDSLRVLLLEASGDRRGLRRFAGPHDAGSTGAAFWDDVRRLTAARAALGVGDAATACARLEPLLDDLRRRGAPLGTAEAALLHALACSSLGRPDDAARAADAALESTAPQQRTGPWIDAGPRAVPLLERAVDRALASPVALSHAASLIAALRQQKVDQTPGPLSERELAVLRLLAAGHTNQQIGKALFLAVGTVKKHTHNIFTKLGVSNRIQAVGAAQARGLLADVPPSSSELTLQ
jgi:LuxR family transcriptional regulator, maltose regulon positive regulatory protein